MIWSPHLELITQGQMAYGETLESSNISILLAQILMNLQTDGQYQNPQIHLDPFVVYLVYPSASGGCLQQICRPE